GEGYRDDISLQQNEILLITKNHLPGAFTPENNGDGL
ncbi:MAG: hypothetical protein ACI909_004309, partial [Planctomycetota bacterium]